MSPLPTPSEITLPLFFHWPLMFLPSPLSTHIASFLIFPFILRLPPPPTLLNCDTTDVYFEPLSLNVHPMFIPLLSYPPPSHHTHYKSLSLTPNPYHNKNAYRFAKKRKFASLFWFFVLFLRNNLQIPEKNQFWERWAREAPLISCFFYFFYIYNFRHFISSIMYDCA